MFLRGEPYEPKSVDHARSLGIDTVYQDLALIDELSVFQNMFLRREQVHRPLPFLANRAMRSETREALDEIGIDIRNLNQPVARLSGGQRQAIAVARTVHSAADILLLDEPLAAMGAKEGALILDLIERLKHVGRGLDHHGPAQLRARAGELRSREPDPGRRDRARQADRRDLGRGADGDRRQRVPARAAGRQRAGDRGCVSYVVGVDFGTLSARAVVVDARDGAELAAAVHEYAHGVMDGTLAATGAELPPQWALQDPADYVEALRTAVPAAVRAAGIAADEVVGIGTDFTASTPMPVLADGTPLCRVPGFEDRPHAYVKLWKHHAAQRQADRVNAVAEERGEPWLARYGGRISSEWEFAKALQVLEEDPEIYERMDRWIEAADWIVWQLCGRETRNICTAGYKAIHQDGRYPSEDYLRALDPRFADFVAAKLDGPLAALGARAGELTAEAARLDRPARGHRGGGRQRRRARHGAAAQAIEPGQMLMVMGTSTCHVMNGEQLAEVPGMCGVVDDGIVPGL